MFQTLWVLLAYSYNVILVLFIAIHLFVGAIISFLAGLYIGVYLSQNYDIPRINEPRTLWENFLTFLEKNRRDPEKISVSNILQPSTMKELVIEEQPTSTKIETHLPKNSQKLSTNVEADNLAESEQFLDREEEIEMLKKDKTDAEDLKTDFLASHKTSDNPPLILSDLDIEDLKILEKCKKISTLDTLDTL